MTCALPLGDARRRRRARFHRRRAERCGVRGPPRHLRGARHRSDRESLRPHRHRGAASDADRPHRRGAAGRRGAMDASAVRQRSRGRRAVRARRGRHEGRDRLQDGGGARLSRRAWRQAERLDLVPDHRRRGRHRGQRHHQAAAMGGRARREVRPRHPGRADQSAEARRHDEDRPARLAERHARRHRHAGTCRLSGAGGQSGARHHDPDACDQCRADRPRHRAFRTVEPRVHLDRRRQQDREPDPGGSARPLQHPLQRHAHARASCARRSSAASRRPRETASAGTSNGSLPTRTCSSRRPARSSRWSAGRSPR